MAELQAKIARSMEFNPEGLHAIILTLSTRNRFNEEEMGVVASLLDIFGERLLDHVVVVFTNGDHLEDERVTFEEFLSAGNNSPAMTELQVQQSLKTCCFCFFVHLGLSDFVCFLLLSFAELAGKVWWKGSAVQQQNKGPTKASCTETGFTKQGG